jgi:hypothetical protein
MSAMKESLSPSRSKEYKSLPSMGWKDVAPSPTLDCGLEPALPALDECGECCVCLGALTEIARLLVLE